MPQDSDQPQSGNGQPKLLGSGRIHRPPKLDLVRMGNFEVERLGIPRVPLDDVYHRLLRTNWFVFCAVFVTYYLTLNLFFGTLYYQDIKGIMNARPGSFVDAFMFSVQTLATIGYGHLAPASGYINTIVVMESMTGLLSLALWSSIAFARFSRPTARVMFTSRAIVTTDDGVPTLMFRVANGRGNRIVDASISVILLRSERNAEGVEWRRQYNLPLVRDRSPVFALTWTVMHRIDEKSPLRSVLAVGGDSDITGLVVSLTGIDDTFAQHIHAMSSYSSEQIVKAKRFADMTTFADAGRPVLDFTKFDTIIDET
jgi:inward rectifier potassium channel